MHHKHVRWGFGLACVVLCAAAMPAAASAQGRDAYNGTVRIDAHVAFGWYGSFGLGARVDIPIVPDGIVDGVDDDLAISPGLELLFWDWYGYRHSSAVGIAPLVALQWNFYLNDKWSVFPELGIAIMFGDYWHFRRRNDFYDPDRHYVYVSPFLGVGARYHFSDRNALLMRINWPAGLQVGITF